MHLNRVDIRVDRYIVQIEIVYNWYYHNIIIIIIMLTRIIHRALLILRLINEIRFK